jgi:uncharacterized protein YndB with AHSA1/START domain
MSRSTPEWAAVSPFMSSAAKPWRRIFAEYREIVRPRRIVFTFGNSKDALFSGVTVEIEPDGAGSVLTFTHRLLPEWASMEPSVRAGWEGMLEGLARATGEEGRGHTLVIHRTFEAPRILVWKAWTESDHLLRWLCPAGFNVLFVENDLRVGGVWRSGMRSPDGEDFIHRGEYLEIEKPSRLVFTHRWERNHIEPPANTKITVILSESGAVTQMTFIHAGLATEESACSHRNGWTGAFDNLARLVEPKTLQ